MSIYVRSGYSEFRLQVDSPIMMPGHQMTQLILRAQPNTLQGLDLSIQWDFAGQARMPWWQKVWTPDDLADAYEVIHHQLHGYDARGLDPREGPTRLSARPNERDRR
jgi:hypothetical protein